MKFSTLLPVTVGFLWSCVDVSADSIGNRPISEPLTEGVQFQTGGRKAMVRKLEHLAFVESDYSKRFKFDSFDNPKLKELRERYRFDSVIAPGKTEFEQQILLMDWTHNQFKKFGQPSTNASGALHVLQCVNDGHTFFCSQFAQVLVSAAASLGWVDRPLALRRHQGNSRGGSSEHSTTEIWSNQYRKWIMLDPTSNMFLEKDGLPLNAYEIRQEWFYQQGTNLTWVIGKDQKKYKKSDLPIFLKKFEGFGNLSVDLDELDKYGFTAYIPNTDLMDSGFDYAKMFIVQDYLCEGTKWHKRAIPANPAADPYFPINQANLNARNGTDGLVVDLKTMTPNFDTYEYRMDGGEWQRAASPLQWVPRPGNNRLEVRTVNKFGRTGPPSVAEVEVERQAY